MTDNEQLDAFALAAMQGLLPSAEADRALAEHSYRIAGAMIDARRLAHAAIKKRKGETFAKAMKNIGNDTLL